VTAAAAAAENTPSSIIDDTSGPNAGRESVFRARNSLASQYQLDNACDTTRNIVQNPNFAPSAFDTTVYAWDNDSKDRNVATLTSIYDPTWNSTVGQFSTAAVGQNVTANHTITLCAGHTYELTADLKQDDVMSRCTFIFTIIDRESNSIEVLKDIPTQDWGNRIGTFMANLEAESVVQITLICGGHGGMMVADGDGLMKAEVHGVSITRLD
jgi:hypothetical protein